MCPCFYGKDIIFADGCGNTATYFTKIQINIAKENMNVLKRFLTWRRTKKNVKQLEVIKDTFNALEKAERGGLIWFDQKNRRLFIEEPLAMLMMTSARRWQNFLQNCFTWLYWRQCSEAWDNFILKEEMKTVRRTKKKTPVLTKRDVERIRFARRQEIAQGDMEPPRVEPFEFFVVRAAITSQQTGQGDKTEQMPGGEIMAVGNYNPETEQVEMASWEDVKGFVKEE